MAEVKRKMQAKLQQHSFIPSLKNGLTFIEILLLLMLLVILIAIVISVYLHLKESQKEIQEKETILSIENAMKFYKLDNGFYPTTEQGVSALVIKPITEPIPTHWRRYLPSIPLDQWGKPYRYTNPGKYNEIDVYSTGPDKKQSLWTRITNWHH